MVDSSDVPFALVVDDNPIIRTDAADILTDAGFRPLEADDVAQAVRMMEARAGNITLILTDVQMPGGRDGFDLAREASERRPDVKILIAEGTVELKAGDIADGAVFIGKSFSADVVRPGCTSCYLR